MGSGLAIDTEEKKRIKYLDLAKGLCIVLVVFFHAKGILDRDYWFDPFLSSFRMPLYFLLSGLFFRDYGSFMRFLTKKVNRLLVPFLTFYLLTAVLIPNIAHLVWGTEFQTVIGLPSLWAFIWPGQYPNIPIWFLWCLFLMNVMFWFIHSVSIGQTDSRSKSHSLGILIVICLICGFAGWILRDKLTFDVGNLFKALASMPFFCFGHLLGSQNGLTALNNLKKARALPLFCIMLGISLFCSLFLTSENVEVEYLLHLISGLAGAMMIVILSRMIVHLPFISYIGRYSIILVLTHGILIRVFTPLCHTLSKALHPDLTLLITTLIILLSYLIIIPLARRYFPHVTAQKPLFPET